MIHSVRYIAEKVTKKQFEIGTPIRFFLCEVKRQSFFDVHRRVSEFCFK